MQAVHRVQPHGQHPYRSFQGQQVANPHSLMGTAPHGFCRACSGKYFLILVDALSNWPEVAFMSNPTTEGIIRFLRSVFSREGLPRTVVTDNGPQFTSDAFTKFCRQNGIDHVRTPPYHPSSNGEAERMVKTLKKTLLAMVSEPGDEATRVQSRGSCSPTAALLMRCQASLLPRSIAAAHCGRAWISRIPGHPLSLRVNDVRTGSTRPAIRCGCVGCPVWVLEKSGSREPWCPRKCLLDQFLSDSYNFWRGCTSYPQVCCVKIWKWLDIPILSNACERKTVKIMVLFPIETLQKLFLQICLCIRFNTLCVKKNSKIKKIWNFFSTKWFFFEKYYCNKKNFFDEKINFLLNFVSQNFLKNRYTAKFGKKIKFSNKIVLKSFDM